VGAVFATGVVELVEAAAGAALDVVEATGVESFAAADFFELRDFFGDVVESLAVFASAVAAASSVDFLDFDVRFLGVSVVAFALSAAVAESAVSAFLEWLLDFGLEVSAAAESVAVESDFFALDLDFGLEAVAESEAAALEDWAESSAAAFFLDFDLDFDFAALESV
jgi:hypothetical protein